MTLTSRQKSRISSLLKRGRSLLAITKITGHSRMTIRKTREEVGMPQCNVEQVVERESAEPHRCAVCGGMTTFRHCLVCELRRKNQPCKT